MCAEKQHVAGRGGLAESCPHEPWQQTSAQHTTQSCLAAKSFDLSTTKVARRGMVLRHVDTGPGTGRSTAQPHHPQVQALTPQSCCCRGCILARSCAPAASAAAQSAPQSGSSSASAPSAGGAASRAASSVVSGPQVLPQDPGHSGGCEDSREVQASRLMAVRGLWMGTGRSLTVPGCRCGWLCRRLRRGLTSAHCQSPGCQSPASCSPAPGRKP